MHAPRQKQDTRHRYAFEKEIMKKNPRTNSRDKNGHIPFRDLRRQSESFFVRKVAVLKFDSCVVRGRDVDRNVMKKEETEADGSNLNQIAQWHLPE